MKAEGRLQNKTQKNRLLHLTGDESRTPEDGGDVERTRTFHIRFVVKCKLLIWKQPQRVSGFSSIILTVNRQMFARL